MISIQSDSSVQPTGIKEELIQIQTDNQAIDGSMQRLRTGQKKQSTLSWDALTPTQYQLLIGYFTAGTAVTYLNSTSDYTGGSFSFTGLPTFQEADYVRGVTLLRPLTVTIRET